MFKVLERVGKNRQRVKVIKGSKGKERAQLALRNTVGYSQRGRVERETSG